MSKTIIYCNQVYKRQIDHYVETKSLKCQVLNIEEAPIQVINRLLHDAFKERLDADINFDCASFSDEEYRALSSNGNIITIWNGDTIVGTVYLGVHMRFGNLKCGFHEYLAVKSDIKKSGIGSRMQSMVMELANALDLDILLSSTAMPATSSVKWHRKNGFIPYKITHYEGRNYNSYNFIKPVKKSLIVRILVLISPLTLFVSKITK